MAVAKTKSEFAELKEAIEIVGHQIEIFANSKEKSLGKQAKKKLGTAENELVDLYRTLIDKLKKAQV